MHFRSLLAILTIACVCAACSGDGCDLVIIGPPVLNHPPVADAGPDQAVKFGDPVRLSCAGSTDPDGDLLTCEYEQVAGQAVSVSQLDNVTATFIASTVSATIVLEAAVFDGTVFSYDTVEVRVVGP